LKNDSQAFFDFFFKKRVDSYFLDYV